jgi:Rieske Fe-S protein
MSVPLDDRRSALAKLVIGGAALIGAGLAGLVGLVAAPRAGGPARKWRKAASVFDLGPTQPYMAVLSERHADGWFATRRQTVVFVDRDGDGFRVLAATCTHLGCGVLWDATAKQYKCPCHGGVFDREGKVLAGPPPRPLDRLPARLNPQTSDIEVEL